MKKIKILIDFSYKWRSISRSLFPEEKANSMVIFSVTFNQQSLISLSKRFDLFFYLFYLYIYPPDSQESDGGANT